MKTVAVILARGGSKGVPNKNIKMLGGEPLIYYTINAAKWSDVDEVWVSTDSSVIKSLSKKFGARVLDRPVNISGDKSSSEEALLHFAYREHWYPRWTMHREPLNFQNENRPRRQDRRSCFVENGAFYITRKDLLLKSKCRTSGNIGIYEMLPEKSVQIDSESDFKYVEKLL